MGQKVLVQKLFPRVDMSEFRKRVSYSPTAPYTIGTILNRHCTPMCLALARQRTYHFNKVFFVFGHLFSFMNILLNRLRK
jgi:hypothetical protein